MSSSDKAPKLDPKNWSLFKLKFNAYLPNKDGADDVLSQPRPGMPSVESLQSIEPEKEIQILRNQKEKERNGILRIGW